MAATEVKVPDIGDFKDVPVIELLVKPGDTVKKDDSLLVLESDKATLEVPAPAAGVIAELKTLHAFDRVRCRGIPAFHVQLLLGCTAINLKRLANHVPTAHEGRAAACD